MMKITLALLLVLGCAALEKPSKLKESKADSKLSDKQKREQLQKKINSADWSHPAATFRKFFGSRGLTRHSLSDAQMSELLVEVENKSEWQAASMTTYWDCSSQYCLSFKNGRDALKKNSCPNVNNNMFHRGPRKTDHAHENLGLFQNDKGHLFGTVAASSSLGVDDKDSPGCGKCYTFRKGEMGNFGGFYKDTKLTVMVSNWCPSARDAPCPAAGKTGEFGTKFHFDLAVPGGGMGTMPTCAHAYEKEDTRGYAALKTAFNNTLRSCSLLPLKLRDSCSLFHKKVAGYPLNIGVAFAEVACPPELTQRFECNKACPTCDDPLTWKQMDGIIKKGGKLSKGEQKAYDANLGMSDLQKQEAQSFREKLGGQLRSEKQAS